MRKTLHYGRHDETLVDIIHLCLSLDKKAFQTYKDFSRISTDRKLKRFWKQMSEDEHGHIKLWKQFLAIAKKGTLPHVFDTPFEVKKELESIHSKTDLMVQQGKGELLVISTFHMACRLEFYLLHPAFARLFRLMNVLLGKESLEEDYETHLSLFIDALNRYGETYPELELIGESIQRLWQDNKQLLIATNTDSLTGILNRRGFSSAMKPLSYLAQRSTYHVGVMMLDIDSFKEVNDTRGHLKGDEILRSVAQIIRSTIRASDIVARYGGDEFIVYFSNVAPDALLAIAEKIRTNISAQHKRRIPLTLSIGISHGTIEDDIEAETDNLIKMADECLYRAKTEGKDRIIMSG